MTAFQLHDQIARLEAERAAAMSMGVEKIHAYVSDLEEELELARRAYVFEAVTEIASLRAELFGPLVG